MDRKLTLRDFNAHRYINLLSPIRCECGCGGYTEVMLPNATERFAFASDLLMDVDCNNAMIIIISLWDVCGAITTEDDTIKVFSLGLDSGEPFESLDEQVYVIREFINEMQPHCIGILQCTEMNCYRVVTNRIYDEV